MCLRRWRGKSRFLAHLSAGLSRLSSDWLLLMSPGSAGRRGNAEVSSQRRQTRDADSGSLSNRAASLSISGHV